MKTTPPKPNIFDYPDYRSFLKAAFVEQKKRNPLWSYNAWAKHLGLKNSTSLTKIIQGQREAGPSIMFRLANYFSFKSRERQYFEDLVGLAKSKRDPERKVTLLERLRKTHPERAFRILDEKTFSVMSDWWHVALRALLRVEALPVDPALIAKKLRGKITPKQAAAALTTLRHLDLVRFDTKTEKLMASEERLNTADDISNEAIKRYHEGVLGLARDAVREVDVQEREISGLTVAISEEDIPRMKEFIRRMQDEFMDLFDKRQKGDVVYKFENALFPLSISSRKKSSKEYL